MNQRVNSIPPGLGADLWTSRDRKKVRTVCMPSLVAGNREDSEAEFSSAISKVDSTMLEIPASEENLPYFKPQSRTATRDGCLLKERISTADVPIGSQWERPAMGR